jgi:hypothetical protein
MRGEWCAYVLFFYIVPSERLDLRLNRKLVFSLRRRAQRAKIIYIYICSDFLVDLLIKHPHTQTYRKRCKPASEYVYCN